MRASGVVGAVAPGIGLCIALALAGEALAARLALPLPGAVIGLGAYLALLALPGDWFGWSRAGAALLVRWLGAMLVPALLGLNFALLAGSALPLALLLVVTTLVTGVATALLYARAGGGDE